MLPKVHILGTGGSISGIGPHRLDYTLYPEVGKKLTVDELLARIPEARELAEFCFTQAKSCADNPSGPKWMAEGLKAQRLARNIRDKINEIENDAKRMAFMARMKAGH